MTSLTSRGLTAARKALTRRSQPPGPSRCAPDLSNVDPAVWRSIAESIKEMQQLDPYDPRRFEWLADMGDDPSGE